MYKVIRNGETHQILRCKNCECVFEITGIEWEWDDGTHKRCTCPECGYVIYKTDHNKGKRPYLVSNEM